MAGNPNAYRALIIIEESIISAAFVKGWLASGNSVAAFWTTDREVLTASAGQKIISIASSVPTLEEQARRHKIPVEHVESLKDRAEIIDRLSAIGADTLITVMTHLIVPEWLLAEFGDRAVNIHPALLPHYKGPMPLVGLLADRKAGKYGGMTIHRLDTGIDTGAIIAQRPVPTSPGENFHAWVYRLAVAGERLARKELQQYLDGELEAVAQVEGSGNYRKGDRLEFMVEPSKTLEDVRRLFAMPAGLTVRAVSKPMPGRRQSVAVHRSAAVISEPSKEPPRITPFSFEMDIQDCRIRMPRMRKAVSIFTRPALPIILYRVSRLWGRKDEA
ncbi:formyltransferase family protein [Hoeflea sp.]|uniref:formyltransferase family protein n=1 Tax=Hoeflea sp. TaxID=1940281 RepID=UPI003B018B16